MKNIIKQKQGAISFGNRAVMSLFGSAILTLSLSSATAIATTIILGNLVGNAALCAANLVFPVYNYGLFFCNMIYIGSSILYFRNLGECNEKRANEIFGQGIILSVILGILLFVVMVLVKDAFLDSLNVSAAIRAEADIFWNYMKYMILIAPVEFLLSAFLYTDIPLS